VPRSYPRIANFPQDVWHVSLLGAITQNPTSTTENNIRVHLGRLLVSPEDAGIETAVDRKQCQVEEVTIGSLPLIHAGSVWKNGHHVPPKKRYRSRSINLTISDSTTRLIRLGDPLRSIEGQEIRLPLEQLFAPESNRADLEEWGQTRWISVDTGTTDKDRNKILIPVSEIVRFYYLSSTTFAQLLFSQRLAGLLEDLAGKVVLEEGRRVCVLPYLPDELDKNDAWILARLIANPLARDYALNVWRGLAAQSARKKQDRGMFLGAGRPIGFPFQGETRLSAHGRWLRTDAGTTHFVVAWLESCTHPMNYDGIHIENLEGFESTETPNLDQLEGSATHVRTIYRRPKQNQIEGELREDINAPRRTKGLIFKSPDHRFPDLKGKSITGGVANSPAKRSVASRVVAPESRDLSTSTEGRGEATRARYKNEHSDDTAKSPEDYVDQTFDRLVGIVAALKTQAGGLACRWLQINQPDITLNRSNFLPTEKLSKLRRRWLHIEGRYRQAAIIEVTGHPKGTYYLFDIERAHDEHFALIMGFINPSLTYHEAILKQALEKCALDSGVWPYTGDIAGLTTVRFAHTFKTISDFALEIRRTMNDPSVRKHTLTRPKRRKIPAIEDVPPVLSDVQNRS
jgi:hypothetical protein